MSVPAKKSAPGQYAEITGNNMPWLVGKKKVSSKEKPVIYPIFQQVKEHSQEDKYWQDVFDEMSRGKFGKGISYKNNILYNKKSNKDEKQVEVPTDPLIAYSVIIQLLREGGSLKSKMDEDREVAELKENLAPVQDIENCTWGELKKYVKQMKLLDYTLFMKNEMKLTDTQKDQMSDTINISIGNKTISKTDVILVKGKIQSINNLTFDNDVKRFFMNVPAKKEKAISTKDFVPDDEYLSSDYKINLDRQPNVNLKQQWNKYSEGYLFIPKKDNFLSKITSMTSSLSTNSMFCKD